MNKIIEIRKIHTRNLILSFLIGFCVLYGLEHFGSFNYRHEINYEYKNKPSLATEIPYDTKVIEIEYITFFNNIVSTEGNGFTLADLYYSDTDFNNYKAKSYYYTQATIKDFKNGVYISLGLFITSIFLLNFKIKLT